jgi:hypothetical protein
VPVLIELMRGSNAARIAAAVSAQLIAGPVGVMSFRAGGWKMVGASRPRSQMRGLVIPSEPRRSIVEVNARGFAISRRSIAQRSTVPGSGACSQRWIYERTIRTPSDCRQVKFTPRALIWEGDARPRSKILT